MEVDDDQENNNGGQEVHQVGQVWAVEGLVQSANLVGLGCQKMEKCNDSSLELGTAADVDSGWWECLPDDGFADVGGNEKRDTGAETVALGKKLVQQENNQTGDEELNDNQAADSSSHLRRITVHSSQNVDNSLAKSHDHTEKLLGTGEEGAEIVSFYFTAENLPFFGGVANFNEFCAGKQLHDETRSDDWWDTQLHKSTAVGGEDDTNPVKRISWFRAHDTKERNLTAYQENKKRNSSPQNFFAKLNLSNNKGLYICGKTYSSLWLFNLWQNCTEGLDDF